MASDLVTLNVPIKTERKREKFRQKAFQSSFFPSLQLSDLQRTLNKSIGRNLKEKKLKCQYFTNK